MFAPAAARSPASTSVSASVACLVIPYMLPAVITDVIEQVLTTCAGSPCASIRGTNVRTPYTTDQKLTDTVHSQSLAVAAQIGPSRYPSTPALLFTRWIGPNRCCAASASASMSASLDTSVFSPSTGTPAAESSETVASSASCWMSPMTTFIPSAPQRSANALPMPLPAPVTTAVLPANCSIR